MIRSCNSMPSIEAEAAPPSPCRPAAVPEQPGTDQPAGQPGQERVPLEEAAARRHRRGPVPPGRSPGWRGGCGWRGDAAAQRLRAVVLEGARPAAAHARRAPPEELPARASAIAGASARVAAKKSASRMRQFSSRLDMAAFAIKFVEKSRYAAIWARAQTGGSTPSQYRRRFRRRSASRRWSTAAAAARAGMDAGLLDCWLG